MSNVGNAFRDAMIGLALLLSVLGLDPGNDAVATDGGQIPPDVPDSVRAWFKRQQNVHGIPCCDIADGHRVEQDIRENQYWVPIDGIWVPIPEETIIYNSGNPTGSAVVWYTRYNGKTYIRCFVPGAGT